MHVGNIMKWLLVLCVLCAGGAIPARPSNSVADVLFYERLKFRNWILVDLIEFYCPPCGWSGGGGGGRVVRDVN